MFINKLEAIRKYLAKNLNKGFIVTSSLLFILSILFVKKTNKELRFYVDYRKLNTISKKN